MTDEIRYTLALENLPQVGLLTAKRLIETFGTATEVYAQRNDLSGEWSTTLKDILKAPWDNQLKLADQEITFAEKGRIQILLHSDARYPTRLGECPDAPLHLFFRGGANLNVPRIVSMVGTRRCTPYGTDFCNAFVRDLQKLCPDTLIVSGLAYGIDIHSHRAALEHHLPTVGVLAHGLDRIYPYTHRSTAIEMLQEGGLLTEFFSGSQPEKYNFVSRNRIVAGMCDATVVVESADKGGSLITGNLAVEYNREVFALPGSIHQDASAGCNKLIQQDKAHLLTSAEQFAETMGWITKKRNTKTEAIQTELFQDLSEEERLVLSHLEVSEGTPTNLLALRIHLPIQRLNALLFEMELKGLVRPLAGGMYRRIS